MSMSRVDYDYIYGCLDKRIYTGKNIRCDSYCCTAEKTSLIIFCFQRIFDLFLNIFNSN